MRLVPGSPWGTFTIACTIPIALFVGLYMYRIRRGTSGGGLDHRRGADAGGDGFRGMGGQPPDRVLVQSDGHQIVWAMAIYGFVASVLPVWLLLAPRDYLSSFLKIGTIAVAGDRDDRRQSEAAGAGVQRVFAGGGPVVGSGSAAVPGDFSVSLHHHHVRGDQRVSCAGQQRDDAKMIRKESDARTIGYGAMLIEGLVGVVAMIAAATLPPGDYYAMNMDLAKMPAFHEKLARIGGGRRSLNVYDEYTQESLRGRSGRGGDAGRGHGVHL